MESAKSTHGIDLERVRVAAEPVLQAHGVSLVDLEWTTERVGWTLRVTIERVPPEGEAPASPGGPSAWGVTLEDCAEVSRDLSTALDATDAIPCHYSLEVSSPGLERRIRSRKDFERFRGMLAKVKLSKPAPDGQRVLRGTIEESSAETVAFLVDGKRIEVPFADVVGGNLVYELATSPKPKPKGGRAGKGAAGKGSAEKGRA